MARMGLGRTGSKRYKGYLRSPAWNWRRQRWFRDLRAAGVEPACQVCGLTLEATGSLDLHHTSYKGVEYNEETGKWSAREKDRDLLPMCRHDHEALHRIMDGRREYHGWNRRRATVVIAAHLRRQFEALSEEAQRAVRYQRIVEIRERGTDDHTAR